MEMIPEVSKSYLRAPLGESGFYLILSSAALQLKGTDFEFIDSENYADS